MPPIWEVVGGADKGGILVRQGKDLTSEQASSRLSTGALILEKEMHGERMRYFRLMLGALSAAGEVKPGAWIPSSSWLQGVAPGPRSVG